MEKEVKKGESRKNIRKILITIFLTVIVFIMVLLGFLISKAGKNNNRDLYNYVTIFDKGDFFIARYADLHISCMKFNDKGENISLTEGYKKGDVLTCLVSGEWSNDYTSNEYFYSLSFGSGFEVLDEESNFKDKNIDGYKYSKYENFYRIKSKNYDSVAELPIEYKVKIKENATNKNLYVTMSNIYIKTKSNEYLKLDDYTSYIPIESNHYYIYNVNGEITATSFINDYDDYIAEYNCSSDNCLFIKSDYYYNSQYIFFNDGTFVIYDYINNKRIELDSALLEYTDFSLDYNYETKEIYGIYLKDKDDGKGYYSIVDNRITINSKDISYLYFYGDVGTVTYNDKSVKFYKRNGEETVPNNNSLIEIKNSNLKYYYADYYYIYDSNMNRVFNDIKVKGIEVNDNIILFDDNFYYIYDKNYNLKEKSNEYDKVISVQAGYIITYNNKKIEITDSSKEVLNSIDLTIDKKDYNNIYSYYDELTNTINITYYKETDSSCEEVVYNYNIEKNTIKEKIFDNCGY